MRTTEKELHEEKNNKPETTIGWTKDDIDTTESRERIHNKRLKSKRDRDQQPTSHLSRKT